MSLRNFRIMIVEDEYVLAVALRNALTQAGAIIIGPEPTVERAMSRIESKTRIDAAVLDINLNGTPIYPVADGLTHRGIPFAFVSGYGKEIVTARYPKAHHFYKPPDMVALLQTLEFICNASK